MVIIKKRENLNEELKKHRQKGQKTGFVPTMGALHQGHISLINEAHETADYIICSIFVNPTQFNDKKDFEKYPISIDTDIKLLEAAGCDMLFLPSVDEIYPDGTYNLPFYDLGYLETVLEGKYRPGHFQGVCQVMDRLLSLVNPDHLFLGQKDYQQCMVIKRMTVLTGKTSTKIHICPTLREESGLAMSSRNMRLSDTDKNKAAAISRALVYIKENIRYGSTESLKLDAVRRLNEDGFMTDYVEIAYASNLELVNNWDGHEKLVVLAAAYLGDVRLIDNIFLN